MSAKMADEVVYLKSRCQGSTGSCGSGGSPHVQDGASGIRDFPSRTQRVGQLEERSRHWHRTGGSQSTRVHD